MTLIMWLRRARSLPTESLRPIWNHDFRRELAAALALDSAPFPVVFAGLMALAANVNDQHQIDWAGLATSFLILLALALAGTASAMLLIVARRRWLAACLIAGVGIAGFVAINMSAMVPGQGGGPDQYRMTWQGLQSQLWIPTLLAALLAAFAAWRWRTMELADLG
jgi:hypothetical protein